MYHQTDDDLMDWASKIKCPTCHVTWEVMEPHEYNYCNLCGTTFWEVSCDQCDGSGVTLHTIPMPEGHSIKEHRQCSKCHGDSRRIDFVTADDE